MSLRFKLGMFLFLASLTVTCNGFSIFSLFDICYKKFKTPDISKLDAKSIVEDVDKFSENFDERYKELQTFINTSMSQSKDVDVEFYLYTQSNKEKPDHLDQNALQNSHFDYKHPVQVLIHGLQPLGGEDQGTESLKHALLYKGQHNVIVMRYPKVAKMIYTEALKNSFLVAKNAADFLLQLLKTFKITADKLHLIGYEFGGQLAGNIAHHIPGLERLTALDPSNALFDRFPPEHRLSDDDAAFVDVIHTSTEAFPRGLGLAMPVGHQDFYPNGGKHQPGCKHNITAQAAGGQSAADFKNSVCDNVRALELFIESVCDTICTFRGTKCDSYKNYESSHCVLSTKKTMGFYAKKDSTLEKNSKFYLDTNSEYAYCKLF